MSGYRHDLDAAATRIDVLEAQLAEKEVLVEARDASLRAREAELSAAREALSRRRRGSPSRWGVAAALGASALLLTVGLSEAFERAHRAELRLSSAERRLEVERQRSDEAITSLRAEVDRLQRVLDRLDDHALADAPGGAVPKPTVEAGSLEAELLARVSDTEADINDLRLLRTLCAAKGDDACYRWTVQRLRAERSLGF